MKAIIPYDKLQLVNYEGAGNKTPVLSLDVVPNIHHYKPQILRGVLEKDIEFRRWLSEKGRELDADTVMIYYSSYDKECEYVTFIGEPNAPGDAPFSEMCGNGIRSLALHIFLTHKKKQQNYRENGITIWAGMTRTITINEIDDEDSCGFFSVEMGPFQHTKKSLGQFTSLTKNEMFNRLGVGEGG